MYGFTIVLRRKNKYEKGLKKDNQRDRTRRRSTNEKRNKKIPVKFSKFLPIIFLALAVTAGMVLSKDYPSKATEEKVSVSKKDINYFVYPEDDYSFYYVPIVINGIEKYDKSDDVSDEMIAACCWSLLTDKDAEGKYEAFDEKTVIPEKDVRDRFEKLFGKEAEYSNRTVNVNGCKFEFHESDYTIETTGMTPTFLPKLLKLESEYGKVTLTVGCLKNEEYAQDADGNIVEPEPAKKMKFVLTGDGEELHIKSIETIEKA